MTTVPPPPDKLTEPNLILVPAKTVLHRVHARTYAGNAFNPCRGGPTRFAPIQDRNGRCVPSLYAGGTVESAIFETAFHDIPLTADSKTVPASALAFRLHSTLLLQTDLRLASLRTPDLAKWGLSREQLIGSHAAHYARTAQWAEAIHQRFADVQGLIWTSNLCDPDDALLLFGDRVGEAAVEVVAARKGIDASFLEDARKAGWRAGIRISL